MTHKNDTNPTEAFNGALSGVFRNGMPVQPDTQKEPVCHFIEALMDEILAKRPGLMRTKLSKQMAEMGF